MSPLQTLCRHQGNQPQALVQILRMWQEQAGWLQPQALQTIATELHLSLAHVRSVAEFYRFFYLEPVGQYHLLFPDNIIEDMAGAQALVEAACQRFGVTLGQTRADGRVRVGRCSCIGMSDQGVSVLINQRWVVTHLDPHRLMRMAELIEEMVPVDAWPPVWFEIHDHVRQSDILLQADTSEAAGLHRALALGPKGTLDEIVEAQLRGRGGAGFRTGDKWTLCRQASGAEHIVVCNADEGEPGTFKDRVLLTHHADAVIEGMTVAAWVLGARRGFIYLRGEYRYLLEHLNGLLQTRRQAGLLGVSILGRQGFDFDLQIHVGAGAYVCGEESALIESLEGKRGTPRIRPPFPVEAGYLGYPTVVNNVETFAAVSWIAQHGAQAWLAYGTESSRGTKIHSVSGDCERPGIYEFSYGVRIRDILEACGAQDAIAVQVGGPSGTCVARHEFDRCITFEDVPTAGAFMVFGPQRDLFEVARQFSRFFAHESCGFCTPCRVGTALVLHRLDKLAAGRGSMRDFESLVELDHVMHTTTHCGLGAAACNHLRDVSLKFRSHLERRMPWPHLEPAFDLDAELAPARAWTHRDDPDAHLEAAQ